MRRLIPVLTVALALSAPVLSSQQVIGGAILPVLDAYLESLRVQSAIPGMSAALVKDGVIVWEKGYGFQNVVARVRATPSTPYLIGDASGILGAVLALQCVERRHLDLDRPIGAYSRDVSEPNATLRQVLSHTAADPAAEPFLYAPARYAQIEEVVESCTRVAYRKAAAAEILDRLAMRDSAPGTDLRDPTQLWARDLYEGADLDRYRDVLERMALPYKIDSRGRAERIDLPIESLRPDGGLVSTVRDLARLDAALDDRLLLREETLETAWQPALSGRGTPVPFGLGWFVQSYRGQRVVWHFGQVTNAYSSLIVKLPDNKLTFILLANSDRLSSSFQLQNGEVTKSLFAALFLKLVT